MRGDALINSLRADIMRKMKWIGGNSYRRIADILQDMNELSRLIENEGSQGKSLFPDALAEDKEGHAAKRFALKEGVLTQEFVLKRMKRLSNSVWVVDMEQFLRDLLRLPQVAEVWDFGPPSPQHNPEGIWRRDDFDGDEMKSIFNGDACRTYPLLCGGPQREWSRDRLIKKYQEALDRGERTEDETDVGEESENEEGEEEEEEIEDGLDRGGVNDGASDCASDDEAADLAAHFHTRKNRAREDERVQAIPRDSLKEMWVWFGTSNDDATLSNPLQKGATKCLQWELMLLNLHGRLRWSFMALYCSVALPQLKDLPGGLQAGIDALLDDLMSFFQRLAKGIPMATIWGDRM
eukprot:Cvel_14925.t1-p1 / transcript=Cvel_14925.t1 / gene=Cvel_14925 / organism=Chromera_velia_CCMP2878 / gene_product=hypothetical protein / transcript_product=hypothetical protein / location=Cvel_scaffold1081:53753-55004(+) / protein_length=350 / sequence_SO=supercontig / SO=protein_coding / is_pseudo=false